VPTPANGGDVDEDVGDVDGSSEAEHTFRRGVLAITIVGAAWRLIVLASKWNEPLAYGDAWYYSIQAINNAKGRWFKEASGSFDLWGVLPGAEHPPLTSVVITPASLLSNPEFWQRATITMLGIAVVPLVAVLARTVGGRRAGLIAGALAAIYPNLWLGDALVMSETLTVLMVVVVLLLALRHHDRFSLASAATLGATIGFAAHARSELLLYVPLLALVGLRSQPLRDWTKRAGLVVLLAIVVVVPWITYNTSRFDTFVMMSTNEGSTWLGANCPPTYSGPAMGGWILDCLADPEPPAGENTAERSARRRDAAFTFMSDHASRVPLVVASRLLRSADLFGVPENVRADVAEERPRWAVWLGMACWWVLAPLAAYGLWRMRPGVRWIMLVPVIGVVVVTLVFYGSHRLRAPLEPIVVVAAGCALAELSRRSRAPSPKAGPLDESDEGAMTPGDGGSHAALDAMP
jgi:4-amino-4-deoxy-L-arabinose transferase-like glycosyltransferase